ncbi:MAG: QueT transporter family protein [Oscillospiraceae bacterium]|nr:QueT transporter family protein [Oscillospiraceae bacterium]
MSNSKTTRFTAKYLARAAIIAAIYVILTYLAGIWNLAYGPVQFRFSEALTVLPFLMPEAIPGLFVGCIVSNLLSPYGLLDLIVGSLATLIAAVCTARCRSRYLAPLPPVLSNAILVGAMIAWYEAGFGPGFPAAFAYNALTVGAGEAVVCYVLGLPLIKVLEGRDKRQGIV